jgi:hypothetical protein
MRNCNIKSVKSSDPKIIPSIYKTTILPNTRGDILKIEFDPNVAKR